MYAMKLLKGKEMGRISRVFLWKIETAQAQSRNSKLLRYLVSTDKQEQQNLKSQELKISGVLLQVTN